MRCPLTQHESAVCSGARDLEAQLLWATRRGVRIWILQSLYWNLKWYLCGSANVRFDVRSAERPPPSFRHLSGLTEHFNDKIVRFAVCIAID